MTASVPDELPNTIFRYAWDALAHAVVITDLHDRVRYWNDAAEVLYGYTAVEAFGRRFRSLIAVPDCNAAILAATRATGSETHTGDRAARTKGGRILTVSIRSTAIHDEGVEIGHVAICQEIAPRRGPTAHRVEDQLDRALRDDLNGIANRTLLTHRLDHALIHRHSRDGGSIAIVLIDLDQFRLVNECWGHAVGDALLVQVAARFNGAVRGTDTVARFGGDEFVVLCTDATEADALPLARRLLDGLDSPFEVDGRRVYVTASLGVAVSPPHALPDLVRAAEAAMYEAKTRGRGKIRLSDAARAGDAADQLALSNDLRDALHRDELTLCYQPIVDLRNGRVVSVEALARWHHPTRGPISPVQFVSVAEAAGFAPTLDRWALARACREAEQLSDVMNGATRIAVNISAHHLADSELEDTVLTAMRGTRLADGGLILEITETAVMDNPERAVSFLHRLRTHGVEAAIDDFGTGYSSLSYLKRLPVSTLKIDRSFISEITENPDDLAITSTIVHLADTLRLKVIAEGIETAGQLGLLRDLGCTTGQGYLFSPGLPPRTLRDVVTRLPNRRFKVAASDTAVDDLGAPTHAHRTGIRPHWDG
jgi:diguanylate cyclase (GGDEF)-like protein/PAS domain S-box-containing protein